METYLAFSDVLILPKFSFIESRKDVDTKAQLVGRDLKLGIISANMDTVSGPAMCKAMAAYGALGCLHRFWSIDDNVAAYKSSEVNPWVSVGTSPKELDRAKALLDAGADTLVLDVAHGACMPVVMRCKELLTLAKDKAQLVVGNFASSETINDFMHHLGGGVGTFKVGIGPGSVCSTRIVTGCGAPLFSSVMDCVKNTSYNIIADGGVTNSGDFAKALAVGAKAVMCGNLLAGTNEASGEEATVKDFLLEGDRINRITHKHYRGSASKESYESQGKASAWRTPEGESTLVPCKGPVADVLQQLEAGLRSSMSYVGATNLQEYRGLVEFIKITSAGHVESKPHLKS